MNDEILVPLDLSDAIAMIDRQKQQITALAEQIERLNLALSYKVKAVFLQGRKDVLKEGIEEGYDCPIHGKQETGDCPRC